MGRPPREAAEPRPESWIDAPTIAARIDALAARISDDHDGADELVVVGVLRGAFVFVADLVRRLRLPCRVEFIAVESYTGAHQADAIRPVLTLRTPVRDRAVLIVEDIVDSGRTLAWVQSHLAEQAPASVRSAALVRKPSRHRVEVRLDYVGFDVPDVWVVGYGLDYDGRYRELPYLGRLEPPPGTTAAPSS